MNQGENNPKNPEKWLERLEGEKKAMSQKPQEENILRKKVKGELQN